MLQIKNLNYNIAGRQLLRDINWTINPGRHIALVGPNGAGKTTTLRIISGVLAPDEGDMHKPNGYQIGYLPQEEVSISMPNILDGVIKGHEKLNALKLQIDELNETLASMGEPSEKLLLKLSETEDQFGRAGGYRLEADAKAILAGLGFKESDFSRPLADFSGGWRMRVYLGRLLLQNPDLLLLDEPTNHLDIESLIWLEGYLRSYPGSIITVSHDRYFVDRIANEIAELENSKLTIYTGNYSEYETQKAQNQALLLKKYEEQKDEIARIERFIERFRYKASKAPQVQSRVKMLEKIERIEIPPERRNIRFDIQVETQSYKDVLSVKNLYFKYDKDWVLSDVNLNLYRGEKIALVGINGAGKTTLTKLIFGQMQAQQGSLEVGERVKMGYYAQHQVDTLNLDATILEEVAETAADTHRTQLRDILGVFQFSGDEPDKRIGVLSGGEKARVSLAKILLSPVNFLIMDEPTNHLDIASQAALEEALLKYNGTLLLISHDRHFLDRLVNRVVELKDGGLRQFEGKYSDYLEKRNLTTSKPSEVGSNSIAIDTALPIKKSKDQKRREAEARQAISKERRNLQKQIENCEKQIQALEAEKLSLETLMANPDNYGDGAKIAAAQKRYGEIDDALLEWMEKWESTEQTLEKLISENLNS